MDEVMCPTSNEAEPISSSSFSYLSSMMKLPWRPSQLAFVPYASAVGKVEGPQRLRVAVRNSLVERLTKDIVETYKLCNPLFKYSDELNLKRYLTSPSLGVLNDGYDNANSDLILSVNCVLLNSDRQKRYIVKDMLGHGTFGQVAKCWVSETSSFVAVKVIKNQPAYYHQALVEVTILSNLNTKHDPEDKHHIVRIYDYFVYQRHLCIAFELLDTNLYELIKMNKFKGVTLNIVQLFSKQILCGLALMKDAGIIHCDLKPENILLCPGWKPPKIKIIDFGSACMEDRTVYSYIQSRYYRSPEVLLGYQYTTMIDMWSFGCIVAELFLGLPLFPGASEFDILRRMIQILGGQPPDYVLKEANNTNKFFRFIGSSHYEDDGTFSIRGRSAYQALSEKEYEARELKKPSLGKEYFSSKNLEEIVTGYPYQKNLSIEDIANEKEKRLALIDFIKGLLEFDPAKRWSPFQASKHPFLTGDPFNGPYRPPTETPRMPVSQKSKVDHHPGRGHWFNAGLSPNITVRNQASMHNSPQFHVPYAHANSYGSIGSFGSYNDGFGMGSSYGSYGDHVNTFAYCSPGGPSALNVHTQGSVAFLGGSPDARRLIPQFPYGGGLGVSPSAGSFAPMAHTPSSLQYTPSNSYGSSGQYGPTSPARGNSHGSPLGKMSAPSQFNRRKSWGYSGNLQSQESPSSQHSRGPFSDSSFSSLPDGSSQIQSNPYGSIRKHYSGEGGTPGSYPIIQKIPGSFIHGSSMHFSQNTGTSHEKAEASLTQPDPADWDPNYSEELLLQEDANGLSTEFNKGMHLGQATTSTEQFGGAGRSNWRPIKPNPDLSNKRSNGPIQAYSHVEVGSPTSSYDPNVVYTRFPSKPSHLTPHPSPNFQSRLGQHSVPRFNHSTSPANRGGEWNNSMVPPMSGANSGGQHASSNGQLNNGSSWGRRGNNPITHTPSTHGRKDYGRIS